MQLGSGLGKTRRKAELLPGDVADELTLKRAGLVPQRAQRIKVIASGSLDRAVTPKGLLVTPGARSAIEAAGGKIED